MQRCKKGDKISFNFLTWPVKVHRELSPAVVGQTRPGNVEVDTDARVEGMEGAGEHLQRSHHPRHGRLQGGQVGTGHPHKDVIPRDRVQVHESWSRPAQECYTNEKRKKKFSSLEGNSEWSGCKVIYMRKGFLNAQIFNHIWGGVSHIWLCNRSLLNFLTYEENLIFLFNQCTGLLSDQTELIPKLKVLSPPKRQDGEKFKFSGRHVHCTIIVHSRIQNITEHFILQ